MKLWSTQVRKVRTIYHLTTFLFAHNAPSIYQTVLLNWRIILILSHVVLGDYLFGDFSSLTAQ